MQFISPVLLRLLVDTCEGTLPKIESMGLPVAEPFTYREEFAEQEAALLLPVLKDPEQARLFGAFIREQFNKESQHYFVTAHSAVLLYDPDIEWAFEFDEAYQDGWQAAHHRIAQETHASNVQAFIAHVMQCQVTPGMAVTVHMPAGEFAGRVVYVHPLWHAVAVELADGRDYPRVIMLGADHDMYTITPVHAITTHKELSGEMPMAVYQLKQGQNGVMIVKDGHTLFLEDVVKGLNRMTWLEQQLSGGPAADAPVFTLRQGNNGEVISKDGHTMFLEDAVKGLNRMTWLEKQFQARRDVAAQVVS